MRKSYKEQITNILKELDDTTLASVFNEYQDCVNGDNHLYKMEMLDDFWYDNKPSELARSIFYGNGFNPNHEYFYYNGYGNICSTDYVDEYVEIYLDEIAQYCLDNEEDFCINEIMDVIVQYIKEN